MPTHSCHYRWCAEHLELRCQLQPRARADAIVGPVPSADGPRLKIRVKAPPVDGAANRALIALLAKQFGVAKSAVSLVQGTTGRLKTLRIHAPDCLPAAAELMPQR